MRRLTERIGLLLSLVVVIAAAQDLCAADPDTTLYRGPSTARTGLTWGFKP
jgi:hypothetical protein